MTKIFSIKKLWIYFLFLTFLMNTNNLSAQCQPSIKIDGNQTIVGETDATSWVSFPLWLKENQSLAVDQMVRSISVIEFNVSGNTLEFSQVIPITTLQSVPSGKVWKVESVIRERIIENLVHGVTYNSPGTHSFIVPSCVSYVCVEVWGAGGGGANGANQNGGGGGGGGYGKECFNVTPGTQYAITVGAGGSKAAGGTSSFGSLVSATGGGGSVNNPAGGVGGTSTATFNISGATGAAGADKNGGSGGQAGNGGTGGNGGFPGEPGFAPGGGGGGGGYLNSSVYAGGTGASGQVKISW